MVTRFRSFAQYLMITGFALGGVSIATGQERGGGAPAAARNVVSGTFKSADAKTITIAVVTPGARGEERREPNVTEKTFDLGKDVEVAVGMAGFSGREGRAAGGVNLAALPRPAKLADFASGIKVTLSLAADQKTVDGVIAEAPTLTGTVKAIDATKNTLTLQSAGRSGGRDGGVVPGDEHTLTIEKGAEIAIDDGRSSRFSLKEAKLADIAQGALVTVRLGVDKKTVQSVLAEGPSHHGTIKAIDPAKRTLTLAVRGEGVDEYSLTVAADAVIVLDNGKGRPLSVKLGKLSDIPVGAAAFVKMSIDQVHVMSIRAEGATLTGHLKSVDADKVTVVISIPKGRDDADEKTLSVAKDVNVVVDGRPARLADLKVGDNTHVMVRLTLDNQMVQAIMTQQAGGR